MKTIQKKLPEKLEDLLEFEDGIQVLSELGLSIVAKAYYDNTYDSLPAWLKQWYENPDHYIDQDRVETMLYLMHNPEIEQQIAEFNQKEENIHNLVVEADEQLQKVNIFLETVLPQYKPGVLADLLRAVDVLQNSILVKYKTAREVLFELHQKGNEEKIKNLDKKIAELKTLITAQQGRAEKIVAKEEGNKPPQSDTAPLSTLQKLGRQIKAVLKIPLGRIVLVASVVMPLIFTLIWLFAVTNRQQNNKDITHNNERTPNDLIKDTTQSKDKDPKIPQIASLTWKEKQFVSYSPRFEFVTDGGTDRGSSTQVGMIQSESIVLDPNYQKISMVLDAIKPEVNFSVCLIPCNPKFRKEQYCVRMAKNPGGKDFSFSINEFKFKEDTLLPGRYFVILKPSDENSGFSEFRYGRPIEYYNPKLKK